MQVAGGSTTSATVSGLANGQAYTFTVAAVNSVGTGSASAASNAVTPKAGTVPAAPSGVSAVAASGSATVSWTAPADNGGSALTGYTITPYVGSTAQTPFPVSSGSATSAKVTGLTDGTAYTFTVTANNAIGSSQPSSPSSSVTPIGTIFDNATPQTVDSGDSSAVTLGVVFKADVTGWVTGVRFYKAQANTGTHIGSLWTTSGTLLASATFSNETASGWQQVTFSSPVDVVPGSDYVVSYYAPNGHYSFTSSGLSSGVDNAPLHAIGNSTTPDGLFSYGTGSTFPTSSFNAANYWVDPTFVPNPNASAPPAPSNVSASPAAGSASVTWSAPSGDGGSPISGYVITPYLGSNPQTPMQVAGGSSTSATVSGLANGQAYTFTVAAVNSVGTGSASAASNAVTPKAGTVPAAPSGVSAVAASGSATVSGRRLRTMAAAR